MAPHKLCTVYLGDLILAIRHKIIPRAARGSVFKNPTVGGTEASWIHGFNAACSEIEIAVRDLKTFTAEDVEEQNHDNAQES